MDDAPIDAVMEIVLQDLDRDHRPLLDEIERAGRLGALVNRLRELLRLGPGAGGPRVHLLQERAILVTGDALWRMVQAGQGPARAWLEETLADVSAVPRTRECVREVLRGADRPAPGGEDAYLAYINAFLTAVNEREMMDFRLARDALLAGVGARPEVLRLRSPDLAYRATVPMRVGISSANASDNWTCSKLRGGRVVNFAVDLAAGEGEAPRPPVRVSLEALADPVVELVTRSRMRTDRPTRTVLGPADALQLLAIPAGGEPTAERCFRDISDPLLLLKYGLVFTGIVRFHDAPAAYLARPARLLEDVTRFAGGRGLRLCVESHGPSRSGFASSSCVALGLLRVLYGASGQEALAAPRLLSSLALLLENEVGLKSGKQDTDGPLYPGVKSLLYPPTAGFLEGRIERLPLDEAALGERLWLVDSGIQRPAATGLRRGLNMRHYSYLSRDPVRVPAVVESLEVHAEVVQALASCDWSRLGALFDRYLDLRELIDPGATRSVFDAAAGPRVLRLPFERLRREGLIHGGLYTGAMGGGCMVLVAAPRGLEPAGAGRPGPRIAAALEDLRAVQVNGERPFERLHVYRYAVNERGLEYREEPR